MSLAYFAKSGKMLLAAVLLIASSQVADAAVLVQHDAASGFTSTGYYNDKIGTTLEVVR